MNKALIIGIDKYPRCPLGSCVIDAKKMNIVLERHEDGKKNFHTKLLIDQDTTLGQVNLRKNIEELFSGDNEISLLYFSGHGSFSISGGYVVSIDGEPHNLGISMDEILSIANKSKAKNKIILLDCCNAGAFGSPNITDGKISMIGDGVTLLAACKSDESAMGSAIGGTSAFTGLLIEALNGGAADLTGNVTPGSIYAYIDKALGGWGQRPIFKTNVSSFVSLRECKPPIELSILRNLVKYFNKPDDEYKLSPEYEDTYEKCDAKKIRIFKELQKFCSSRIVVPVGEEHMYFAAMKCKSCRLTLLGQYYWKLVYENKI